MEWIDWAVSQGFVAVKFHCWNVFEKDLELARAVSQRVDGEPSGAAAVLQRAFFLRPLFLSLADEASVTCELDSSSGRLEVASVNAAGGDGVAHFAAVRVAGAAAQAIPPALRSVRECCPRPVVVPSLYASLRSMGLEYAEDFRTLQSAWAAEATVAARLRGRKVWPGGGVPPADLDGALQLASLLSPSASKETRMPFAIAEARVGASSGRLWAAASQRGADDTAVWLGSPRADAQTRLSGFESRALTFGSKYTS